VNASAPIPNDERVGRRGRLAGAVARSIDQVPGVVRSASLLTCTVYPGGYVEGVVLSANRVTVHIAIDQTRYGEDLRAVGDSVRLAAESALKVLSDSRTVAVKIVDLTPPDNPPWNELV
jgi:hypothetical protein